MTIKSLNKLYQSQNDFKTAILNLSSSKHYIIHSNGKIGETGALRHVFESIKGFFGKLNYCDKNLISYHLITLFGHGAYNKWLTEEDFKLIKIIAERAEIIPPSTSKDYNAIKHFVENIFKTCGTPSSFDKEKYKQALQQYIIVHENHISRYLAEISPDAEDSEIDEDKESQKESERRASSGDKENSQKEHLSQESNSFSNQFSSNDQAKNDDFSIDIQNSPVDSEETNRIASTTQKLSLGETILANLSENIPPTCKIRADSSLVEAGLNRLLPNSKNKYLVNWVEDVLTLAAGVGKKEQPQIKNLQVDAFIENLGFFNTLVLLATGYQLALQNKEQINGPSKKQDKAIELFSNLIKEWAEYYPSNSDIDPNTLAFNEDNILKEFNHKLSKSWILWNILKLGALAILTVNLAETTFNYLGLVKQGVVGGRKRGSDDLVTSYYTFSCQSPTSQAVNVTHPQFSTTKENLVIIIREYAEDTDLEHPPLQRIVESPEDQQKAGPSGQKAISPTEDSLLEDDKNDLILQLKNKIKLEFLERQQKKKEVTLPEISTVRVTSEPESIVINDLNTQGGQDVVVNLEPPSPSPTEKGKDEVTIEKGKNKETAKINEKPNDLQVVEEKPLAKEVEATDQAPKEVPVAQQVFRPKITVTQAINDLLNNPEKFDDPLYTKFIADINVKEQLLSRNGLLLSKMPDLQNNPWAILIAIKNNLEAFEFADSLVKKNENFILEKAMSINPEAVRYADSELLKSCDFMLKAVSKYGLSLEYAEEITGYFPTQIKDTLEIVEAAINEDLRAWKYAGEYLDYDKPDPVTGWIKVNKRWGSRITNPSLEKEYLEKVKTQRSKALKALLQDPKQINSPEYSIFKGDIKVAREIVKDNGLNLQFFPDFQSDFRTALLALKNNISAAKFVNSSLFDNEAFIFATASFNLEIANRMSSRLKEDKPFALKFLTEYPLALEAFEGDLQNDVEVVESCLKKDIQAKMYAGSNIDISGAGDTLKVRVRSGFISNLFSLFSGTSKNKNEEIKEQRSAVLDHLKKHPEEISTLLKDKYYEFTHDIKTARALIEENGLLLELFPDFQDDIITALLALKNIDAAKHVSANLWKNPLFIEQAVDVNKLCIFHMDKSLDNDHELAKKIVSKYGPGIEVFNERIQNTIEIVQDALQNDLGAQYYAGNDLTITIDKEGKIEVSNRKDSKVGSVMSTLSWLSSFVISDPKIQIKNERFEALKVLKDNPNLILTPAYEKFVDDIITMRELVQVNGENLDNGSSKIRDDATTGLLAIANSQEAARFISPRLLNNANFMLEALKINNKCSKHFGKQLKSNRDFALKAVKIYGLALKDFDESIQRDEEVVQAAVNENPAAGDYAGSNLSLGIESDGSIKVTKKWFGYFK